MSYPLPIATTKVAEPLRQATALLALIAAALYLAGFYLPIMEVGGEGGSLSDGDSSAMWVWVAPSVLALIAAAVGLAGTALASAIAAGLTTGMAGITTFELLFIHRFTDEMSNGAGVSFTKGIGYWTLLLAVVASIAAALSLVSAGADEPRCNQALGALAGVVGLGVSLSILLPVDGVSVLDIGDGVIQFGLFVWALLAPLLGSLMAVSGRRAGAAFAVGVGLGHLGFTAAVMQDIGAADGSFSFALTTNHTAIYHWAAILSVVFAGAALTQVVRPTSPVASFTVGTNMSGYVPASPAQPGFQPTYTAQPQYQQPVAPQQSASQWAADPYGRHQHRLWDGSAWTEHVADRGVVGHDPIT
ncbi:MAG: DUF2510 domain-containing protein [Actinomycetota bacterium]|nr:DUF2510 domain-containing protein [Actinomycetota bacterium]